MFNQHKVSRLYSNILFTNLSITKAGKIFSTLHSQRNPYFRFLYFNFCGDLDILILTIDYNFYSLLYTFIILCLNLQYHAVIMVILNSNQSNTFILILYQMQHTYLIKTRATYNTCCVSSSSSSSAHRCFSFFGILSYNNRIG